MKRLTYTLAKKQKLFNSKNKQLITNFQSVVHQHSGILFSICRRYARDEPMAKDFLQDSWLRIYNNIQKYDPAKPIEPWIKRITVNQCLKNIRDAKNSYEELEEISTDSAETPVERLNNEDLVNLVNKLPLVFKAVFNLYVIDGYSHKEIASLLGITEATSRSKLARGRQWLQKKLNTQKSREHELFTT